jgi:hypothetical protein
MFIQALAPYGRAELPKAERDAARETLAGPLYLRIDVPCRYGRQPFGVYVDALVEVTPTGSNMEADTTESTLWTAGGVYWGFGPNDAVKLNKVSYLKDGKIEIWMVGVGAKRSYELGVRFAGINNTEDFKKAFEITFARVPLQDEHADWSPAVKQAIAEKRLIDGMTKRQAFAVVGKPLKFEVGQEGGKQTETWSTRQSNGLLIGYWTAKGGEQSGFPVTLKFVDGVLTGVGSAAKPAELNLDK